MKNKFNKKKLLMILTFCMLFLSQFFLLAMKYLSKIVYIENARYTNFAIPILICLPFLLGIYIYDINKKKLDIYDYIFFALVITGFISTVFATDISIAVWGSKYRNSGFLVAISYYLLCMNWKNNGTKKDIKPIINMIFLVTILNSIYALLQVYTDFNFIFRFSNDGRMASGLCSHPNFFGTLMVTSLGLLTYYILTEKITIKRILLYILFLISLVNSQSTGPLLAFVLMFIFLIIYFLIKKQITLKKVLWIIIFGILIVGLFIGIIYVNKNVFNNKRCELCQIERTIKTGGTGRLRIWQNSIEVVKDNWLVGVGYDNLYLVYPTNSSSFLKVDNAHNVYLHELVTTGILGFVPYMLLVILTFIRAIRSKNKSMFLLFSGFLAYIIQALTNINVIYVTPIFFLIMGLMLSLGEDKKLNKN